MRYIFEVVELDATKPLDVELFQSHLRNATSDPVRQLLAVAASESMLITAILCDTTSPQRMCSLADLVLCAAKTAACSSFTFTELYEGCLAYDLASSIGNLGDVDTARIEMGYAISACLPLLPRAALEIIAVDFSECVKAKRFREIQSIIDLIRDPSGYGTPVAKKKNQTTFPTEKRFRYIHELDTNGLTDLLSRLTHSYRYIEAVKKVALSRLGEKACRQGA